MSSKWSLVLMLLAVGLNSMKPSEAGVNDWHIQNIGELRQLTFHKNKLIFLSKLNIFGQLDKHTGQVDNRVIANDHQRVIYASLQEYTIATRYNQIVSHTYRMNVLEKVTDNKFMSETKKIESMAFAGKRYYYMTNTTLYDGKQLVKQANHDQLFLKIIGDKSNVSETIYLLIAVGNLKICIQKSQGGKFTKKICFEQSKIQLLQFKQYEQHLIVSFTDATFVFSVDLNNLTIKFDKQLIDVVRSTLIFQDGYYSLLKNKQSPHRPLHSSRAQLDITLREDEQLIAVYRESIQLLKIPVKVGRPKILRAWFNFRTQIDYQLVIQYTDLQLAFYLTSKGDITEIWSRQQSLAYIEEVLFMKFSQSDNLNNQYHINLISHNYRGLSLHERLLGVPRDIILRLKQQISDIKCLIYSTIASIVSLMDNLKGQRLKKFQMSQHQQIKYGLRKYIVVATNRHAILGIDTKSKQVLWKINTHEQTDRQLIALIKLERKYDSQVAVRISYSAQFQVIYVDQILEGGMLVSLQSYPCRTVPSVYKFNEHSLTIKIANKVQHFSLREQYEQEHTKQFYLYSWQGSELNGWKIIGDEVVKIWNFQTGGEQKILKIASAYRGDQRAHIPLFDKQKVFFKNVDFTNLAILTSLNHTNLALYIINGRTGKTQFNQYKNGINVGLPINLVYDENNVLVSYFNAKHKVFQIWTVQQYQERIQNSAVNMIKDYFNKVQYKPQQNRDNTIFQSQLYAAPVAIKYMYVSESKMSLTRRNLFIITRQNKIYTINRDFVSTRRPKKQSKSFFSSDKLPEHHYLLPFNPTFYLSYDLSLQGLSQMRFSPTDMESSIFLYCFGVDNFLIRTAPDKTFDMITDDFSHLILLLILLAATVTILTFTRYLTIARLKKPHLE